jgi:DNA-binding response OmpR family regulator
MTSAKQPKILLITDDAAEESHTAHILSKYHFTNLLVRIRKADEASRYFLSFTRNPPSDEEEPPELIILGMGGGDGRNRHLAIESRMGRLGGIPLIVVAEGREEEEAIHKLNIPNSSCISRPIGFFKLLEAMQKLRMRWVVLRPE